MYTFSERFMVAMWADLVLGWAYRIAPSLVTNPGGPMGFSLSFSGDTIGSGVLLTGLSYFALLILLFVSMLRCFGLPVFEVDDTGLDDSADVDFSVAACCCSDVEAAVFLLSFLQANARTNRARERVNASFFKIFQMFL